MRLIKKTMPCNFNLFCFGDTHIGSRGFHEKGFDRMINDINSPYDGLKEHCNYAIFMGDAIEAILMDDSRFDPVTVEDKLSTPMRQMDYVNVKFSPIRKKIVAFLVGNHERKLHKFGDIGSRMAGMLGVEYGGYICKVTFVDKKDELLFKVYATHGRKGVSSTIDDPVDRHNSMLRTLRRQLQHKAADCALMLKGHTHKTLIYKPQKELYLGDDGNQLTDNYTEFDYTRFPIDKYHRWYINTGSFLKAFGDNYDSYIEMLELDPVELAYVVVKVRDRQIVDAEKVPLK